MRPPSRCIRKFVILCLSICATWRTGVSGADSNPSFRVSTLVDASGAVARFTAPGGVAVDRLGNVYVSETDRDMGFGNTIRMIDRTNSVLTLAGTAGRMGYLDGVGRSAMFSIPEGLAVDDSGVVYVADSHNGSIRKISAGNVVTTIAQGLKYPIGVTLDGAGNVYVSDTYHHVILKITRQGEVETVAGMFGIPGSRDGVGIAAQFTFPNGIARDRLGNLYVADYANTVRKIEPNGLVTTIAGTANVAGFADGDGSAARFGSLSGLAVDPSGNIYVSEPTNHTLRRITPAGRVSTIAGVVGTSGDVDGPGGLARFNFPTGLAVDANGAVYVADMGNDRVRRVASSAAPEIEEHPTSQTVASGSTVVFTAISAGSSRPAFQWERNGVSISGATDSSLVIATVSEVDAGSYACVVSNPSGALTSRAATLTVAPAARASRLVNLSVRATAGRESQPLIIGFVVGGSGASGAGNFLVRAAGPALSAFGASDVLADPTLTLLQRGVVIAANDDWAMPASNQLIVQAAESAVGAFPYPSISSLDAALSVTLPAAMDGYTARVTGNAPGTTLAEIYDAAAVPSSATPRLTNVSVRIHLDSAASELIAGFTIGGTTSKTVLLRAIGPGLEQFGVSATLDDPELTLSAIDDRTNVTLATNAGGAGDATIAAMARAVGAFAVPGATSRDAAILRSLTPGAYTARIPAAGSTGIVLLEIYEVP